MGTKLNTDYGLKNYFAKAGPSAKLSRAAKLQLPALKAAPVFRYAAPQ